jgi:hypothetical protein
VSAIKTGGGSSAVAASAHAGCERYRKTDPLVTGVSRRKLAQDLGRPDISAGIPEARWMRAMAFERLVRDDRFVSKLLTTAVGALGLPRPTDVTRVDGKVSVKVTAQMLKRAHDAAVTKDRATMITGLAIPFVGMEHESDATPVKPDFAIVVPRREQGRRSKRIAGSWLIMGDAKDYERVRSRIDDQRMLKGFLQVSLGAESAEAWSAVPDGMLVHRHGALAVPRNAFLQPEAVVESLDDHRREVRARVDERAALLAEVGGDGIAPNAREGFVAHLISTFDPASCVTCSLHEYCRAELRAQSDVGSLLVELGVRPELRVAVQTALEDAAGSVRVPPSIVAGVRATIDGEPQWTGQMRLDPIGEPGTVEVVIAKSDAAALGIHGIGTRVRGVKASAWTFETFDDPQAPTTRLAVLEILGECIDAAMGTTRRRAAKGVEADPVHLVVPDSVTGDVLVSIADSVAGVETSRLRWQHDLDMGRDALTFDGEPAVVPDPISETVRLAVSFLLEADRSRAMQLRTPIVDARAVLARHLVPGGPSIDRGRLDYLVEWAEAQEVDHRALSDEIAAQPHTPGARLSNETSDAIHNTLRGRREGKADLPRYHALVCDELDYKAGVLERCGALLDEVERSILSEVHRVLERDAQVVWRRRLALHASDLVRFGRTQPFWRNAHVAMLDADGACVTKLLALGNPIAAEDLALDAGNREVAIAEVSSVRPIRLDVRSRRIKAGSTVVALHLNGEAYLEDDGVTLKVQKTSFKFGELCIGELVDDGSGFLRWDPLVDPSVARGDRLIIADAAWFGSVLTSGHELNVHRPAVDTTSAPKADCDESSYQNDPDRHRWCCRPHESAEAEWSDELAARRLRGDANPQAWPPVVDDDQFDVETPGAPTAADVSGDITEGIPAGLTLDDLE